MTLLPGIKVFYYLHRCIMTILRIEKCDFLQQIETTGIQRHLLLIDDLTGPITRGFNAGKIMPEKNDQELHKKGGGANDGKMIKKSGRMTRVYGTGIVSRSSRISLAIPTISDLSVGSRGTRLRFCEEFPHPNAILHHFFALISVNGFVVSRRNVSLTSILDARVLSWINMAFFEHFFFSTLL